jgi:hypothetical protein
MTRITLKNLTTSHDLNRNEMNGTQGGFLGIGGLIAGVVGSALGLAFRRPILRRRVCRRTSFGIRCR